MTIAAGCLQTRRIYLAHMVSARLDVPIAQYEVSAADSVMTPPSEEEMEVEACSCATYGRRAVRLSSKKVLLIRHMTSVPPSFS